MKISNFIICDDIRMELGNKMSLMGIYPDTINFNSTINQQNKWPKSKSLALYAQIKLEGEERLSDISAFKIEIDYDGEIIQIAKNELHEEQEKKQKGILINALFNNFQFKSPGEIKFKFYFLDQDDNELYTVSPNEPLRIQERIINQ
ncbi:MAG: hypothetical protein KKE44_22220 [Proteobacteria bacterium]|nr:hypothetical protein [Pseudomonadota bacterium]MBU1585452.1 hypothetical protein [Pseudomonadota bacterium]